MYQARSDPKPRQRVGRPREFSAEAVVSSAKLVFWRRGYEGSTLSDLEASTGLSRSSLYQAYGSKEGLFDEALAEYIATFISPRLAPMERPGSGLGDIQRFFRQLGKLFRGDLTLAQRGCLWVNTLAEFSASGSLKGVGFGHFAAFFSRAYRENDYLMGRIHALDRLIDIVCNSARTELIDAGDKILALKKRGFNRILDAEEKHLPNSTALIAALRLRIARLAGGGTL